MRHGNLRRNVERVILVLVLIAIAIVAVLAANVEKASAGEVTLEDGATFNGDGTCVEADGTPGLARMDGECITVADYDELFSYENLSTIQTFNPFDGDTTVAELAGITAVSEPASVRPRSFMGEQLPSFDVVIKIAHGLYLL